MSQQPLQLTELQKKLMEIQKQETYGKRLRWQSEASRVIDDKIKHYTETGNARKLDIYLRKKEANTNAISILKKALNL